MGLTIHYELHSSGHSPKEARRLVEQLRQRAGGGLENAFSFGLEMALSRACPLDVIFP